MKTLKNVSLFLIGAMLIAEYLFKSHESVLTIIFGVAFWALYTIGKHNTEK